MSKIVEDMRNETAAKTAIEIATSLLGSNLSIEDIAKQKPVELHGLLIYIAYNAVKTKFSL